MFATFLLLLFVGAALHIGALLVDLVLHGLRRVASFFRMVKRSGG